MESSEIRFGRFRLDLRRRTLLRDDLPVRLGGRPPAILFALASAGGDVLTQNELMARLWSGYVVEEGNLYVHVSALRRALADRSVSGRVRRHDVAREYGARMTEEWLPLTLIGSGREPDLLDQGRSGPNGAGLAGLRLGAAPQGAALRVRPLAGARIETPVRS